MAAVSSRFGVLCHQRQGLKPSNLPDGLRRLDSTAYCPHERNAQLAIAETIGCFSTETGPLYQARLARPIALGRCDDEGARHKVGSPELAFRKSVAEALDTAASRGLPPQHHGTSRIRSDYHFTEPSCQHPLEVTASSDTPVASRPTTSRWDRTLKRIR